MISTAIPRRLRAGLAATLAAAAIAPVAHAQRIVADPVLPQYGQDVTIEVRDLQWPGYLPATRYVQVGNNIVIDVEYSRHGFGPRPDFGSPSVRLGELAPGNYTVEARLVSMDDAGVAPRFVTQNIAVVPPSAWGIYTVPQQPQAFEPSQALVRSAAYFDPGSMRVSTNANVIRVDFDYRGDAPVGGATPQGMTSFASVRLPTLAPGHYVLEGWGRDKQTGLTERYFTRAFTVDSAVTVVEYYAESTDHYFMTAAPDEIALLDAGSGWKRTGHTFKAWLRMGDAPPNAAPVCRFYASGPNSHFYTSDRGECEDLKAIEASQRQEARAKGRPYLGWAFENTAFYVLPPQNGQCWSGTKAVYRAYNQRAEQNDSNHRFTVDPLQRVAMALSWADEGIAFCSPL